MSHMMSHMTQVTSKKEELRGGVDAKDGRDDGTRDLVLLNASHMYIVLIGPY